MCFVRTLTPAIAAVLVLFGLSSSSPAKSPAPATAAGPMQLTLTYQNDAWRRSDEPPQMTYADGYMLVTAKWPTSYTEKDPVSYVAWIDSQNTD